MKAPIVTKPSLSFCFPFWFHLCSSLFADLRSSSALENPHLSLTKFFALDRLINQSTSAMWKGGTSKIFDALPTDTDKSSKKSSPSHYRNVQNSPKVSLETHVNEKLEWVKGDGAREIQELKDILLKESQNWFLKFLEGALSTGFRPQTQTHLKKGKDGTGKRRMESDDEIAVTLAQLKLANDWLDQLLHAVSPENMDLGETINQLKQKIYACLLDKVESAASALESRSGRNWWVIWLDLDVPNITNGSKMFTSQMVICLLSVCEAAGEFETKVNWGIIFLPLVCTKSLSASFNDIDLDGKIQEIVSAWCDSCAASDLRRKWVHIQFAELYKPITFWSTFSLTMNRFPCN